MKPRVGILSVGLSSSIGSSLPATWHNLMKGNSVPHSWRCPDGVTRNVGTRSEGGSDVFSLAEDAIQEALESVSEEGASKLVYPEAIIVGSSSDTVAYREANHPPTLQVSARLDAVYGFGAYHQISTACASSSYAIAVAMDLIRANLYKVVIVGGTDEVTFSSIQGFSSWRVYGDRCRPFAADRHGLILSEGAAFLVLAKEGVGRPIAYLAGAGMASDAENMSAMNSEGVLRAIADSAAEAGSPYFDAVIAHGTGTDSNDTAESEAILKFSHINANGSLRIPHVVSYKGLMGHPQGASGAIGVVLAVKAILEQELFATVAPEKLDPELGVAEAVTTAPMKTDLNTIQVLSHGSWGVYSALVVIGR